MSKEDAQNLQLLALDWDKTFIPHHMNLFAYSVFTGDINSPIVYKDGISPQDQLGRFFNTKYSDSTEQVKKWLDHTPLPKAEETALLVRTSVEKGLKVAIVTLSRFPDAIYGILQHMGVESEILANVVVVCNGYNIVVSHGYTESAIPVSKNIHIELAMQYFGMDIGNKKSVLYIDDNEQFIQFAKDVGYNTILAMPGQEWVAEAQKWVNAAEELDDGATHMLREQDILKMNMSTCKLWEREHPPVVVVEEALEVSGFVLSPVKFKKKSSTSEDKKPNNPDDDLVAHGLAAAAASQSIEVQLLAKVDLYLPNEA